MRGVHGQGTVRGVHGQGTVRGPWARDSEGHMGKGTVRWVHGQGTVRGVHGQGTVRGVHEQGTVRGPWTMVGFWGLFWFGPAGPSACLDIVHPVHPLATPLKAGGTSTYLGGHSMHNVIVQSLRQDRARRPLVRGALGSLLSQTPARKRNV